jgi:transcriptional regulator with XRE-family HTH domain
MDIGPLITAARKRAGYKTIYQMAQATGLSQGQLYEYEAGTRSPSIESLQRIFDAINWEVLVTFRARQASSRRKRS